jgi:hypothetical protein
MIEISFSDLLSGSSLQTGATFMPAPARASAQLSHVFPRVRRGVLHYNHPVLKSLANLCFESGQTKLAVSARTDYHSPVVTFHSAGRLAADKPALQAAKHE